MTPDEWVALARRGQAVPARPATSWLIALSTTAPPWLAPSPVLDDARIHQWRDAAITDAFLRTADELRAGRLTPDVAADRAATLAAHALAARIRRATCPRAAASPATRAPAPR